MPRTKQQSVARTSRTNLARIFSLPFLILTVNVGLTTQPVKAASCDRTISPNGQNVKYGRGTSLSACNGNRLDFQSDGNLVVYSASGRAVWATGTEGTTVDMFVVQADGNLVLYKGNQAVWASNTSGNPGSRLVVQGDGNVVVYKSNGQAIFATGTVNGQTGTFSAAADWCDVTMRPNGQDMRHGRGKSFKTCQGNRLDFQSDGNLVVYSASGRAVWATGTAGTSVDTFAVQADGNLVLYQGAKAVWASNTSGNPGSRLVVQGDGNVVVYKSNGQAVFATGTVNGQTGTFSAAADWQRTNVNRDTPFLPFDAGVTLTVTQAYNGSHTSITKDNYHLYNRYAVDFGAAGKTVNARASRYGTVMYAGWKDGGYGNVVVIKYSDGKFGRYMHLVNIAVKVNDTVAGGQKLGLIGATGNAYGSHLHYAEALSDFGYCVTLPQFADAPNADFNQSGFSLTSQNPDGRR